MPLGCASVHECTQEEAVFGWDAIARYGASQIGMARSTRVEEDGFAGGPFVGCTGGPLP
jgi:hypothetical protein